MKKIKLYQAFLIIAIILTISYGVLFYLYHKEDTSLPSNITSTTGWTSTTTIYSDTEKVIPKESNIKYTELSSYYVGKGKLDNLFVTSNEELKTYLLKCFSDSSSKTIDFTRTESEILDKITVNNLPVLTYFNDDFFKENNLAIQMYDGTYSADTYSIASVTKNNSNVTVNIENIIHISGGIFSPNVRINYIILDKSINNVNYDIYRTTISEDTCKKIFQYLNIGIIISIVVIEIVSILAVNHNRRIENKPKNKKIIFEIIIGIVIIIIIQFFTNFCFRTIMSYLI